MSCLKFTDSSKELPRWQDKVISSQIHSISKNKRPPIPTPSTKELEFCPESSSNCSSVFIFDNNKKAYKSLFTREQLSNTNLPTLYATDPMTKPFSFTEPFFYISILCRLLSLSLSILHGRSFSTNALITPSQFFRRLLLFLLFLFLVSPLTVAADMFFSPTNAVQASMYQTIQLSFISDSLKPDLPIVNNDEVYLFVEPERGSEMKCVYEPALQPHGVMHFNVTNADDDGCKGYVEVPILTTIFSEGFEYIACYLSHKQKTAAIVRRLSDGSGSAALLIWPPIYEKYIISPHGASGGEGMVSLSLFESISTSGRPHNYAFNNSFTIFLPPCDAKWDCTDLNLLTTVCNTFGKRLEQTDSVDGVILLSQLSFLNASSVTGRFVVPYLPSHNGYFICAPYCPSTTLSCGTPTISMSYTVVAAARALLTFKPATPGTYSRTPEHPQARENGTLTFHAVGLLHEDRVKIIKPDDQCSSESASLLEGIELGMLELKSEAETSIKFIKLDLVDKTITGRVCYWRKVSGMWSSVYISKDEQNADFTIDPLQPSHFTILTPFPAVGKTITLKFTGLGLNGSADKAFLSSFIVSMPCEQISGREDLFVCEMTGTSTPLCEVNVDPPSNREMNLFVFYCKAGRESYSQLRDIVSLGPRNPTYTFSSYPVYAGQFADMEFNGDNLSENDIVKIVEYGKICNNEVEPFENVSVTDFEERKPGISYHCKLVGQADICLTVCYYLANSDSWITTRSGLRSSDSVSFSCPATALYITPYPGRYNLPMVSVKKPITVYETTLIRIENVNPATSFTPVGMKLVRVPNGCVLRLCDNKPACATDSSPEDFVSAFMSTSLSANVMVTGQDANYVVCVMLIKDEPYIPVLPYQVPSVSVNLTTYGFKAIERNPYSMLHEPSHWHVRMATLTTLFSGVGLDSLHDRVYPVASETLLSSQTCPPPYSRVPVVLTPSFHRENSTAEMVSVTYARSDLLTAGVVHFCYEWASSPNTDGEKRQQRMSYVGKILLGPPIPSSFKLVNVPEDGEYYATDSVEFLFISEGNKANVLSASHDLVYFYQFSNTLYPSPTCYCSPSTCRSEFKISYNDSAFSDVTSKDVVPGSEVNYSNFRGFRNYREDTTYVICYSVGFLENADVYLGTLTVRSANPVFYSVLDHESVNRVGKVINILAHGCSETSCIQSLTEDDEMTLIPSTLECSSIYTHDPFPNLVQRIGQPDVNVESSHNYRQRFVVNKVGKYRVCYRRSSKGGGSFAEIPFTSKLLIQPVEIVEADPISFETSPNTPSEGQFLTVNIQCSQYMCSSCKTLRLIKGVGVSCWESGIKSETYESNDCLSMKSIQFPNQYVTEGSYTVCYGDGSLGSERRLPGTLVISEKNPSSFTAVEKSGRIIFTNQVTNFTLSVKGKGLKVEDQAFLLPEKYYFCHDLRTLDIQGNKTLQSWLAPSIYPYPLDKGSDGVLWTVSNISKRFSANMLYDPTLCNVTAASCQMKLCYKRDGMSWAPVPIDFPPPIQIKLPDPSSITFDVRKLIANRYVMVTVSGTSLTQNDVLSINIGRICDTRQTPASVLVGKPIVNDVGTKWHAVLRILGGRADSYTVCYIRSSGTISEIDNIVFPGSKSSDIKINSRPLYVVYDTKNFTSLPYAITRYEEMIVSASFLSSSTETVPLTYVELIYADPDRAECNYIPFLKTKATAVSFPIAENFSITSDKSNTFQGRLIVNPDVYMFCMNTSEGLFRVDSFPPLQLGKEKLEKDLLPSHDISPAVAKYPIVISSESPGNYDVFPHKPMMGQKLQFKFYSPGTGTDSKPLEVGDTVQIVDGDLFSCGFVNSTILSQGFVSSVENENEQIVGSVELVLPDSFTTRLSRWWEDGMYNLTVCYQKGSGTFATTPRLNATVDRNLWVLTTIPIRWESNPTQLQAGVSANITFFGDYNNPDHLSAQDSAFLVHADKTIHSVPNSSLCRDSTPVLSSTVIHKDGINAIWRIPSGQLEKGRYLVCYTAVENGQPILVYLPELLIVYELQSPTGAYSNNDAHSNALKAYRGERFYIFFNTTDELHVMLDDGLTPLLELEHFDVVRISPYRDCSSPLTSDDVDAIPASFGYKPLKTDTSNERVPVPYIHLRLRAKPAIYFVCMQRRGREPWQAYYNSSLVGSEVHPALLTITSAPISAFTTTPTSPRLLVNGTKVFLSFSDEYRSNDFKQLFFVPFGAKSQVDEMSNDNCYRPPTRNEAISDDVVLLNNSLQVDLATMELDWVFSERGIYLLCFQLRKRSTVASVFPSNMTVLNASPTFYKVPGVILKGSAFELSFTALDPIFDHSGNRVDIYVFPSDEKIEIQPSCVEANPPSGGGLTSFTSFEKITSTNAYVRPIINDVGYFFVCFLTYDQSMPFPVQNDAGFFSFGVGITGAQKYEVYPTPSYLGQVLNITIRGSLLSDRDHVKIVRASPSEISMFVDLHETSKPTNYDEKCTASSMNADASAPAGDTIGSIVQSDNSMLGYYFPRVNESTLFVLCYQSFPLGNTWSKVDNPASFTVSEAHPSGYRLRPASVYKSQISKLIVQDTAGLLERQDRLKLVASKGPEETTFRCTKDAQESADVIIIGYVDSESTPYSSVYRICGKATTSVVVCHQLAGTNTWAEVPEHSPPPYYTFSELSFLDDPFIGPSLTPNPSYIPRPYEPFSFMFTNPSGSQIVTHVGFSLGTLETCRLDVSYATPSYYLKNSTVNNLFTVVLNATGKYTLHLGMGADLLGPNITKSGSLVVGPCDPCDVTPPYTFLGQEANLTFKSTFNDFSAGDQLRLFPRSQDLFHLPCQNPDGPYKNNTFTPYTVISDGEWAKFKIEARDLTQVTDYLGEYYLCYRKESSGVDSGNFAIVSDGAGLRATFSILPTDIVVLQGTCPNDGSAYALGTVVFNITVREKDRYVSLIFGPRDELKLVPLTDFSKKSCEDMNSILSPLRVNGDPGVVLPTLESYGMGYSNWYATMPWSQHSTAYVLCFRLEYDTIFRNISTRQLVIQPANPYNIYTTPSLILPDSVNVSINVVGTGLLMTDDVYLVSSLESCAETCDHPINPIEWDGGPQKVSFIKEYVNNTLFRITFSGPVQQTVTLGVCYRRSGNLLTRVGNVHIGEANPSQWSINFTPRSGTRPIIAFKGKNLTEKDRAMIVKRGDNCYEGGAIVNGLFLSIDSTTRESTSFYFALIRVTSGEYTLCYLISTLDAYVEVKEPLTILSGGPESFTTSNVPMQWRTTIVSIQPDPDTNPYIPQLNDEAYIADANRSCFDEVHATPAYGIPYAKLKDISKAIVIRIGFDTQDRYILCYKLADSGYARVGFNLFLKPVPSSPASIKWFPLLTYQGQRLVYNFSGYTEDGPIHAKDQVMLVKKDRGCWEPAAINPSSILVNSSSLVYIGDHSPVGEWRAHVPSLGPDVPQNVQFPYEYMLCYRGASQAEYVAVPHPIDPPFHRPASNIEGEVEAQMQYILYAPYPSTYSTQPATVGVGMIDVKVTFPGAEDGDMAYAVWFETLTNEVCTYQSQLISSKSSAFPYYSLSLSGSLPASDNHMALCYIRVHGSVAEVPQMLSIGSGNPSAYKMNTIKPLEGFQREYLVFDVLGEGLSAENDAVVFTEVSCAIAPRPLNSTSTLARMSDLESTPAGVRFVAQFRSNQDALHLYLCYALDGIWREVGSPFLLKLSDLLTAQLEGFSEKGPLRAGQHLGIRFSSKSRITLGDADVLAVSSDSGAGTWCHNFTRDDVQEPGLIVKTPLLDIPVWQHAGTSRLCVRVSKDAPWMDIATTVDGVGLKEVLAANPSAFQVFPNPPRVGQQVTLTFDLALRAMQGDLIRVTLLDDKKSCDTASSIVGFLNTIPVTVVNEKTTQVTLVDSTDILAYRSFNTTASCLVCYYSAAEKAWSVVGGTLNAGKIIVQQQVPQWWHLESGAFILFHDFTLRFEDETGQLKPSDGDLAWSVPSAQSCGVDPYSCAQCIVFKPNPTKSTSQTVVTQPNAFNTTGSFNVCYRLAGATASMLENQIRIDTGPIQCVKEVNVLAGISQVLTFMVVDGTDVAQDTWRVSFYDTDLRNCESHYVPEFLPEMVEKQAVTATTVSYNVKWPLNLTSERYRICYDHADFIAPVCTCEQINSRSGDCYIATRTPFESFTVLPDPSYVGQTISLTLTLNPDFFMYPPTDVKFVHYLDTLSTCDGPQAFDPVGSLRKVNDTVYEYMFKHDYTSESARLMICVLTNLSPNYMRVPKKSNDTHGDNLLWIRPYIKLSTFPLKKEYLRVMQTIIFNFTHQSRLKDDVVTLSDGFTFVSDPKYCTEDYINHQVPYEEVKKFYLDDSAFDTLPAYVESLNTSRKQSTTLLTFNKRGVGVQYVCYKLFSGTWAPVLPSLTIQPAMTKSDECNMVLNVGKGTSGARDIPLRAMQYIQTRIEGTEDFATLHTKSDSIRVVHQNDWCVSEGGVVFTSSETYPERSINFTVSVVTFAKEAGVYKVCYRIGGPFSVLSNWSPICQNITLSPPSPTGSFSGCLFEGHSIDVIADHPHGLTFNADDRVRYIAGNELCLHADGTPGPSLSTITLDDKEQTKDGLKLGADAMGKTNVSLPYALLRSHTLDFILCYRDTRRQEFAIPINYNIQPTKWIFQTQAQQPGALSFDPLNPQLGEQIILNFTASHNKAFLGLTPYAPIPEFLTPGPLFNGTFDGATLLSLGDDAMYREGRCTVAERERALNLYGVYGLEPNARYTLSLYQLKSSVGRHIVCYRLASCKVADIGEVLRILPYNPSETYIIPSKPRQGQLLKVYFVRDSATPEAALLTPQKDLAVVQVNLKSCWDLAMDAGIVVSGTSSKVHITTIVPAQEPAQSTVLIGRICYRLFGKTWSEMANNTVSIFPANPFQFRTVPELSRQSTLNMILFTGSRLSLVDRVKVIPFSSLCDESSEPPTGFIAYDAAGNAMEGGRNGWQVMSINTDATMTRLNISTDTKGMYSICYKLKEDTVWTLMYASLYIHTRTPSEMTQIPISTLEGEMFLLNFTNPRDDKITLRSTISLSAEDRLALYFGKGVSCINPKDTDVIITGPSRTDLLPYSIVFQLSVANRGTYTVCYLVASKSSVSVGVKDYSPTWGFESIFVEPNPKEVAFFPHISLSSVAYYPHELVSLVFTGFGLSSSSDKLDQVQFIDAQLPYTHESCFDQTTPTKLHLHRLIANGSHAVQVLAWIDPNDNDELSPFTTPISSYWICYKLTGGQYHIIGSAPLKISGTASPSGANASENTSDVAFGQALNWTLLGNEGCVGGDVLYYSVSGCNDRPYYETVPLTSKQDLFSLFPWGASWVDCSAADISLRVTHTAGSLTGKSTHELDSEEVQGYPKLSLCYYHNASNQDIVASITVLKLDSISVSTGVPPVLPHPLSGIRAGRIFSFELDVLPGMDDFLVLTKATEQCSGVETPPRDAALFMLVTYDTSLRRLIVKTAVPNAGTYYICYSHRVEACEPRYGRDCARVIGEIHATSGDPVGWRADSVPVYTSEFLYITLQYDTALPQKDAVLWMRQLSNAGRDNNHSPTMNEVAAACLDGYKKDSTSHSAQVTFSFDGTTGKWASTEPIKHAGSYALCYEDGLTYKINSLAISSTLSNFILASKTPEIAIFYPAENAGPVVEPSRVVSVLFQNPPAVDGDALSYVTLVGSGLSQDDSVMAVGVPSSLLLLSRENSEVPFDICSNAEYTPRVPGNPVSDEVSNYSYRLSEMQYEFNFQETGGYMLCYTSTEARHASKPGIPVTPKGFIVQPTIRSVTVLSKVSLVGVPMNLSISGDGLRETDLAALALIASSSPQSGEIELQASDACTSDKLKFAPVTSASKDGTNTLYSVIPTVEGNHVVCYKIQSQGDMPVEPQQLPGIITVRRQSAVQAVFVVQPASCETFVICGVQPQVELLDRKGEPVASEGAQVHMILAFADNGKLAPVGYLLGGNIVVSRKDTIFDFPALTISTPGNYYMTAHFTLLGGTTLEVNSNPLTVEDNHTHPDGIAAVSCFPVGINPDRESPIHCTCDATSSLYVSNNYSVTVSAGTTTPCIAKGTTPEGLPRCTFTVLPPPKSAVGTIPLNYLVIEVHNIEPFTGWPVTNSPVIIRLPSLPDACTTLSCKVFSSTPDRIQLPNAYIRVGDNFSCTVQGCAVVNHIATNVVVLNSKLRVIRSYILDSRNETERIDIGAYPDDPNGLYSFDFLIEPALSVEIDGSILIDSSHQSHHLQQSTSTMTGSPQTYIILGVPTPGNSKILCKSKPSDSQVWFLAAEPITCVLELGDNNGHVNGIGTDFEVLMPEGGIATVENPMNISSKLIIAAIAPESAPHFTLTPDEVIDEDAVMDRVVFPHESTYDFQFTIQVNFRAGKTINLSSYTGKLIYVSSIKAPLPNFKTGRSASLDLMGSGLDSAHRYEVSSTATCDPRTSDLQKATATIVTNPVLVTRLSFTVPEGAAFYLCVAPHDALDHLGLLTHHTFVISSGPNNEWWKDNLLLFVIGIIFLAILLLLMFVLMYCIFCPNGAFGKRRSRKQNIHQRSTVYIPPMANDRFLLRENSAAIEPVTPQSNTHLDTFTRTTVVTSSDDRSNIERNIQTTGNKYHQHWVETPALRHSHTASVPTRAKSSLPVPHSTTIISDSTSSNAVNRIDQDISQTTGDVVMNRSKSTGRRIKNTKLSKHPERYNSNENNIDKGHNYTMKPHAQISGKRDTSAPRIPPPPEFAVDYEEHELAKSTFSQSVQEMRARTDVLVSARSPSASGKNLYHATQGEIQGSWQEKEPVDFSTGTLPGSKLLSKPITSAHLAMQEETRVTHQSNRQNGGMGTMVGPFLVAGHTSRPMITPEHTQKKNQQKSI